MLILANNEIPQKSNLSLYLQKEKEEQMRVNESRNLILVNFLVTLVNWSYFPPGFCVTRMVYILPQAQTAVVTGSWSSWSSACIHKSP